MFEKRHQHYPSLGYFFVSYPYTLLQCISLPGLILYNYFLKRIFYEKFNIISQFHLTHTWENFSAFFLFRISDNNQNCTLDGFLGCTLEIIFFILWYFFCYTNTNAVFFDRPQRTCVTSRIQTLKDDSLEIMCEGLLSYYSVSSSSSFISFPSVLYFFNTHTGSPSNALKRALVQIFLLSLFISIK